MTLLWLLLGCATATEPPRPWSEPPDVAGLSRDALQTAWVAWECAGKPDRLAVIDYSLPSTEKRLWVLDPATGAVLQHEWVAHGENSGGNRATAFSNDDGSHQTSLGTFRGADTYQGAHGYSLELDGLDAGFNDHARARRIVVHGAEYVSPAFIAENGRLGRSWGCPAVSVDAAKPVIDALARGGLLVAYYPDPKWLAEAPSLRCPAR